MNDTTKEISRLLQLAIAAEDANDMREARRLYARCLELDDGSDSNAHHPGKPPVRVGAWLLYAAFVREQGNAGEALDIAKRAAERWPDSADLHSLIGRCFRDLQQAEEAEKAYRRALAIDPKPWSWCLLAWVLGHEMEGRDSEALQCLHAALELDPNYEEAHYNIGCKLRLSGDLEGAIQCFRKAIELDPDYAVAHAELGIALGMACDESADQRDERREAIQHLERSVALDPNYVWSRLHLANALWQVERPREARVHYEAAVHLWPHDAFTLAMYADFLSSAFGASAEAEQQFERAIALDSNDASVRYHFGKHLLQAGRYSEARRELLLADRLGHRRALALLESFEMD
jgi:tetratricopeptide (TPR) repeat protein